MFDFFQITIHMYTSFPAVCSGALSTLLFIRVEVNITIINHVPIILKLIFKISVFVYIYIYLETKNFMFVLQLCE